MAKKVYVEVTVKRKPKTLMERMEFLPWPKKIVDRKRYFAFPESFSLSGIDPRKPEHRRTIQTLRNTIDHVPGAVFKPGEATGYPIHFRLTTSIRHPEGYALELDE